MKKNLEIERLRALAVLIVINSHLPTRFLSDIFFRLGWPGVDLFFVISGFVISRNLLKSLPNFDLVKTSIPNRFRISGTVLKTFFIRRVFRIIPAAALWIAIPIILSSVFGISEFGKPSDLLKEAGHIFRLTYNFDFYFGLTSNLAYFWSLMVEEHFYLILPFLLVLCGSRKYQVVTALALTFFFAFLVRPHFPIHAMTQLYHWSIMKFDPLLGGVVIGLLTHLKRFKRFPIAIRGMLFLLQFPLIYLLWCRPNMLGDSEIILSGMTFVWLAAAGLVTIASLEQNTIISFPLLSTFFEYIGSRSYGLYLIHNPVITFLKSRLLLFSNSYFATAEILVVSMAFAEISFRLVELPMIKKGREISESIMTQSTTTDAEEVVTIAIS